MMRNFRKNFMGVIVACACLAAAHGSVFGAEPARFVQDKQFSDRQRGTPGYRSSSVRSRRLTPCF
jgi:hypothetical protein